MAATLTTAGEYVRAMCLQHADMPSKTLARLCCKLEPVLCDDLQKTYMKVRYARGNQGVQNRHMAGVVAKRPNQPAGDVANQIPKGIRQAHPDYKLALPAKVLLLSDMHVPYHDEDAIDVALRTGVDAKCDTVYLNGDSIDFYQLSRFVKDPRNRRPKQEVETLNQILRIFERHFPRRVYKEGNHEDRWQTRLFTQAPEMADFEQFELQEILGLEQHGWEHVHSRQLAAFGELPVIHGHEVQFGSPVNPARGIWLKVKSTCAVSHKHQTSHSTENFPLKKAIASTWSLGCLCDLRPEYAVINNWNHGFAIVEVSSSGEFQFRNYRVMNGKAFPA